MAQAAKECFGGSRLIVVSDSSSLSASCCCGGEGACSAAYTSSSDEPAESEKIRPAVLVTQMTGRWIVPAKTSAQSII